MPMTKKAISCLVIVDGKKVEGILTRRDILGKVIVKKRDPDNVKVSEVMTSPVRTVEQHSDALHATHIMNVNRIKRVVVTNNGKLAGVITQTDMVRNLITIIKFQIQDSWKRINNLEKKLKQIKR